MTVRILRGDVRDRLADLDSESVNCCVTSPPYWGLRDYGHEGQIGNEPTSQAFVETMVEVFGLVRRVLREDGTLWLNLGDCYNAYNGGAGPSSALSKRQSSERPQLETGYGLRDKSLKPKDLVGIPWRVALALQADGWWLRQDVIWAKPNPMPESVTDRCTKAHEYLFLLTKSERYYFDADAIAEPANYPEGPGNVTQKYTTAYIETGDERLRTKAGLVNIGASETRNKRSVWTIALRPFAEAHFATFPAELPENCIKAGCPAGGTVLDPFFGAGTTGLVADRLQRDCIGIELNPAYADIAERRIRGDSPLFAQVGT